MRLSREVKTGILAIGAILLFIFGYSYLKGTNLLEKNRTFYVKYKNVEGLAQGAPVTINGLKVGKVQKIDFANAQGGLVVEFTVERDFDFSQNSIVRIYSSGLIGGKSVGIFPIYDQSSIAKSGDTLSGEIQKGMLDEFSETLAPLEEKLEATLGVVDSLLISITDIIDEDTRTDLKNAIANLSTTTKNFGQLSEKADNLLGRNGEKLDRTFTNLDDTMANFSKLSDSLSQIEFGVMVNNLEDATAGLKEAVDKVNSPEGSVGKLLNDKQLYDNLEGATRQLEELIQDVKLNPKRYVNISVFGKRDKGYEPPEDPDL
ncbi:MlaD family protein [Marinirhabdus gelatinilytica]|uniref:Phospholipid/cholesterol/gamma-HCH transport system substrate-binding protein n=1 Tax=Marinirhabdus gelatinilytica TaxID=1703343 RepID=A0A370Q606_9FLAO|nr:MlaD family protein [Marinirhabdus gelatinilytica]RDK83510.1 phospholipid/cholesterol/gamma-HCH transport system substrate-binding protein [Marinirhabdus gelatinilytica]